MNNSYIFFAERKRGKYTLPGNLRFFIKELARYERWFPAVLLMTALFNIFYNLLESVLPALVVHGLEKKNGFAGFFLPIALIGGAMLFTRILLYLLKNYGDEQKRFLSFFLSDRFFKKILRTDYDTVESVEQMEILSNAWNSANNARGFYEGVDQIPTGVESLIGVAVYGIILGRYNPWLLLLVFGSVGVNLYLLGIARKMHKKYYGKIAGYAQGIQYISGITADPAAGKDIRIFQMLDLVLDKYNDHIRNMGGLYGKIHNWYCFRNLSSACLGLLRDGAAYFLMITWVLEGRVSAAMFVFLLGVIGNLSGYFESLLRVAMSWNAMDTSVGYYRQFLALETKWKETDGVSEETMETLKRGGITLELSHVTFTYEGEKTPVIRDFNLTIRSGEKLALIGLNGAGKTTLVKLICGMYKPDSGEIKLGGIQVRDFTREQYVSLISVMFQDAGFLPLSVDENLACADAGDRERERIRKALRLSGFEEKYESLPEKGDTPLVRKVEKEAADFSGGEKQKFLFARAIYKEAPLVILDEPTAALDPIAENELYLNFKEAIGDRSAVYISHRLSSTRFCDRIILLEGGRILEEGTHEELMHAKGRYADLYEMQSKYYREEKEKEKKRSYFE